MEKGISSNLQSQGGAVFNSSGISYVLLDLSRYIWSMYSVGSNYGKGDSEQLMIRKRFLKPGRTIPIFKAQKFVDRQNLFCSETLIDRIEGSKIVKSA